MSFLASIGSSPPTGSISAVALTEGGSARHCRFVIAVSAIPITTLAQLHGKSSSQTSFVTVSVSGSTLTITPVAVGSSSISVTADDNTGLTTTVSFTATVEHEKARRTDPPTDTRIRNPDPQQPEVITNPNAPSKDTHQPSTPSGGYYRRHRVGCGRLPKCPSPVQRPGRGYVELFRGGRQQRRDSQLVREHGDNHGGRRRERNRCRDSGRFSRCKHHPTHRRHRLYSPAKRDCPLPDCCSKYRATINRLEFTLRFRIP